MILETPKNFPDFELLDTGNGYRLERWGNAILQRPDPQIIWPRSLSDAEWNKAWAIFKSGSNDEKVRWEIKKPIPNPWIIQYPHPNPLPSPTAKATGDKKEEGGSVVKFLLKLSPFKHTGLFPEQTANWGFMIEKIENLKIENLKILNLFAYTGGATMVLAKMGCAVTHVDASKPAITWANENYRLNFEKQNPPFDFAPSASSLGPRGQGGHSLNGNVRWILDDAVKFVRRELKRGATYDGIIMDPPAFGHSPTGKTWKFNNDLPGLLADCVKILSDDAKFLIINGYATNSSALALNNLLEDAIKIRAGQIELGELCLKQKSGRLISTGIFARWSKS